MQEFPCSDFSFPHSRSRSPRALSSKRKLGKEFLVASDPSLTKSGVCRSRNKNLASKAEKSSKCAGISKANCMVMHLDLASLDGVCLVDSYKRSEGIQPKNWSYEGSQTTATVTPAFSRSSMDINKTLRKGSAIITGAPLHLHGQFVDSYKRPVSLLDLLVCNAAVYQSTATSQC
ncbi:hypothetical protein PTKIN_Ptkin14bG0110200 [Pterospermum kingtungense]